VALGLVAGAVLAACSSHPSARPAGETKVRAATTDVTAPASDEVAVRVVADSEVPDQVAELLDGEAGIRVLSHVSVHGATMAELDPAVAEALAAHPDVLVYAGGTNDLASGPLDMLAGLEERLRAATGQTCVVVAVPVFRYERGTDEEVRTRTQGTRVLEGAVTATGARVASYLDVSLAMDDAHQDFFAEGELGDLHPGPAAYPRIADAIAEQVRACG